MKPTPENVARDTNVLSKDQLIGDLEYLLTAYAFTADEAQAIRGGIEAVKELKLIYEEREKKLGHWTYLRDCANEGVYCSNCQNKVFEKYPFKRRYAYYCPCCGTEMREDVEIK